MTSGVIKSGLHNHEYRGLIHETCPIDVETDPLERSAAGDYEVPLEMVRLAPLSTNKQPWRISRDNGAFHFFRQRSPGYSKMTGAADLQRIDMGIAMCHFDLAAKERSLGGCWSETDYLPVEPPNKRAEYVVSWIVD